MNLTFLFDIMNEQMDYAKCLKVIDYIQNRDNKTICDIDFLAHVKYKKSEKETFWGYMDDYSTVTRMEELPTVSKNAEVRYVFRINCMEENDVINLIYYCLLNNELNSESILCIKNGDNAKLIANVKDLLSSVIRKGQIAEFYTQYAQEYRRITLPKVRNIKRFSPIFYIDEKEESVAYWRQSVNTFLLKLYRESRIINGAEYTYQENYFLPHMYQKKLTKQKDDIIPKESPNSELNLMNIFAECFCTSDSNDYNKVDTIERRYNIWKSKEFFGIVKEMPLLAMYIFCISNYFSDSKRNNEQEKDILENARSEAFNARDMADGILQLLENIYHSEKRRGYFCFRIHSNSDGRSKPYLMEHYKQYMSAHASENDAKDYLEVKIVDYSHCTIPSQFYINFMKRKEQADTKDRKIYEELQQDAEHIKISSFFESNFFWQKYNSISENVVHHYGLQVFDSLVTCYDGYFRVRSQKGYTGTEETSYCLNRDDLNQDFGKIGIPGTQYDIVIPFKKQQVMQNIALNVDICYTDYLSKEYKVCETIDFTTETCLIVYDEVQKNNPLLSYQEKKEKVIYELENRLFEDLENKMNDNSIIHFPAEKISPTMIEIFCKALMIYIAHKPREKACYIMITDCKESHFVEITRMLALFYDKQGENSLMANTQIFLSGEREGEEFLITGEKLGEVVGSTEKLAFSRCVNPDCLKILKNMLKNRNMGKNSNETVHIVPFDMVLYDKNKPTLFERDLRKVLDTEVQSETFGCKLENLHVRIGSKIHIHTFYEAELLFHNNYYTSRFAYWMRGELLKNTKLNRRDSITLVGYENYSEMLLNELREMLKSHGMEVEYIIYEQKSMEKFRSSRPLNEYADSQFIIIVPINSTMTTHIKVVGFLEKTIREELKKKRDFRYEKYVLPQTLYYGIVLIASTKQNAYWTKIGKKNVVVSKIDEKELTYYVEVSAEWSHPLECQDCFPTKDYKKEQPLVETNKESVIPMQAIGIKRSISNRKQAKADENRIRELSKLLIFDHIERNGNHFNYYFCTEKVWDDPNMTQNITEWLKQKRNLFSVKECKVYDIIVAPLHFSNTVFVDVVNRILFGNAALVLHFDVDKEFRMNVKTKYSSLQQLYDNLCQDDEKSIINFHYVDDTIVSGRTFHRTKSLINSLITRKEGSKTKINVFKSVVLLLNRLSKESVREYIDNPEGFLAYFDLNISSMRVNADACVLCKKHQEWNLLAEQASLNEVYLYWKRKSINVECKSIEKLRKDKYAVPPEKQHRAELSMIASHKAKNLLDELCNCCDSKEIEKRIVDELFSAPTDEDFIDELIAVLKVLGRPFLTFRREIKETSFKLMLTMLDELLQTKPRSEIQKLDKILIALQEEPNRQLMIKLLINRLAELESNYIIRKTSMESILQYAETLPDKEQFANNYLNRVKQLVVQSNDFAKGLYLEFLLLYGEEYVKNFEGKEMISLEEKTFNVTFKRKAYLENTKLFSYGIEALTACMEGKCIDAENLQLTLNNTYYLDNFIQYLYFHKMVIVDETDKVKEFRNETSAQQLIGMVQFQALYQKVLGKEKNQKTGNEVMNVEQSLRDKYQQMLDALGMASGALDAEIIVPYQPNNTGLQKYIALELGKMARIRKLVDEERQLNEFIKNNSAFEGDTYSISEIDHKKAILIKIYDAAGVGDNIPVIYLLFLFDTTDEGELLHALKNILVFRKKIQSMLNLSSSTLLQNWTANLFYKQQMLKSRAVGHSELENLSRDIEHLSEHICEESSISIFMKQYYELLVNSMIGFMNSRTLGGKAEEYLSNNNCLLCEFLKGDKKIFEAACKVWNLNITLENEEGLFSKKIRMSKEKMSPELTVLRILILAVLQNVKKHGLQGNGEDIDISIYEECDKLCISNEVNEKETDSIKREINAEAYRSGEGISQAVIWDICESWYGDVDFQETFAVEQHGEKWKYVVKLPILERKGEE